MLRPISTLLIKGSFTRRKRKDRKQSLIPGHYGLLLVTDSLFSSWYDLSMFPRGKECVDVKFRSFFFFFLFHVEKDHTDWIQSHHELDTAETKRNKSNSTGILISENTRFEKVGSQKAGSKRVLEAFGLIRSKIWMAHLWPHLS